MITDFLPLGSKKRKFCPFVRTKSMDSFEFSLSDVNWGRNMLMSATNRRDQFGTNPPLGDQPESKEPGRPISVGSQALYT